MHFKTYNNDLLCLYNFCLISTDDEKRKKYSKNTAATVEEKETEIILKTWRETHVQIS